MMLLDVTLPSWLFVLWLGVTAIMFLFIVVVAWALRDAFGYDM